MHAYTQIAFADGGAGRHLDDGVNARRIVDWMRVEPTSSENAFTQRHCLIDEGTAKRCRWNRPRLGGRGPAHIAAAHFIGPSRRFVEKSLGRG
jgi:hypothetical protein